MDVRDQALHVHEAVEPGNQFSNCYQKTSSDGCSTMFLVFGWMLHRGATSGLDWYWMDILTSGANDGCWNWNYTYMYICIYIYTVLDCK